MLWLYITQIIVAIQDTWFQNSFNNLGLNFALMLTNYMILGKLFNLLYTVVSLYLTIKPVIHL